MNRLSKILLVSISGSCIEMYDFVIYMFFAPVLQKVFFPNVNHMVALLGVFSVFAVGYLVRPLGGIIFGHIGDIAGRKRTFLLSVLVMTLVTTGMSVLPSYASIGIYSTLLLVLLRVGQGISVAGEVPGSLLFVSEHGNPRAKGLRCGLLFTGINIGIAIASLVAFGINHYFKAEEVIAFAWRIPFIIGIGLGVISLILRKKTQETPVFEEYLNSEAFARKTRKVPLIDLFRSYKLDFLTGVTVTWFGSMCLIATFLYFPTYLANEYNPVLVLFLNAIAMLTCAIANPIFGLLSDRYGRVRMLQIGILLMILAMYPLYKFLSVPDLLAMVGCLGIVALLAGMVIGIYPAFLTELFPVPVRYTGIGTSYNCGFALGSMFPIVATLLKLSLPTVMATIVYFLGAGLMALLLLTSLKQLRNNKAVV